MTKKYSIDFQDLAASCKNSTYFNGFNGFLMQAQNQYLERTLKRSLPDIFSEFLFLKLYYLLEFILRTYHAWDSFYICSRSLFGKINVS